MIELFLFPAVETLKETELLKVAHLHAYPGLPLSYNGIDTWKGQKRNIITGPFYTILYLLSDDFKYDLIGKFIYQSVNEFCDLCKLLGGM